MPGAKVGRHRASRSRGTCIHPTAWGCYDPSCHHCDALPLNGLTCEFSLLRNSGRGNTQARYAWSQKRNRGISSVWPRTEKAALLPTLLWLQMIYALCFANPISEVTSVRAASLQQQEDNLLHTELKQQPTKETLSLPLTMIIVSKAALVIQECCLDANISAHSDQRSGITAKRQRIFMN